MALKIKVKMLNAVYVFVYYRIFSFCIYQIRLLIDFNVIIKGQFDINSTSLNDIS